MTRWTLRGLTAMTLVASAFTGAFGQGATGTVAGQVTLVDTKGPLIGAQVSVAGTTLGAVANAEGRYVIRNVPAGTHTINVKMLGFSPKEQPVTVTSGGTVTANFEMKDIPFQMQAIVTTAMGIAREEKAIGYATTTISSTQLEKIPEPSLMQALAGQSPGVTMVSGSGRPGAGALINIRGQSSFSGTGQPLFVIDGIPVSTANESRSDALGTGTSGGRQMDFDMENVEELTILKGAAATALYGSRAANGAVIIKTKSGKSGQPLRFNFSSELRYDTPLLGGYQTDWAAGTRGYFCNGKAASQGGWCESGTTLPNTYVAWGPHKDSIPQSVLDSVGEVRFRDARADFYKGAPSTNNTLRGSGSMGDLGVYTLGGSYLKQNGINPAEALGRFNLNGNITIKFNKWLSSTSSVQRTRSTNLYSDDSFSGIDHALIDLPPTLDVRQGYAADGVTPIFLNGNGTAPSMQWRVANEGNKEVTNRWIASQMFDVSIVPGLHLRNNAGLDTYVTEFGRFIDQRPWLAAVGTTSGSTQQRKSTRTRINDDLTLNLDPRAVPVLSDRLQISALVGGNINSEDAASITGNGSSIVIPDYFNIGNFATQTVSGNLTTQRRLLGAYSQVEFNWADYAYLTFTGRNDWSSTLPTNANSYFYPSAALTFIFTDAFSWLHPSWLDYGKLRVSKAKVGNDAPQYALTTRFNNASVTGANNSQQQAGGPSLSFPFRGVTSYISSTALGNPILKPESTVEDELGLDFRMFGGRMSGEISAYNRSSYDQIFSVPSSSSTGFTSISRNAGNIGNKGIEVSLGGRPIDTRLFSWDARVNWAKNHSSVLSLAPGVSSIYLSGYSWPQIRIMEGQPYGVVWGYGWKKNCVSADPCYTSSPEGTMLIDDNGYPIRSDDQRNLGTVQPDWTGSVSSEFRLGRFSLSGLVDGRHGGKLINFETQYEAQNGRSIFTNDRYTWTTWDGLNINTGKPNTKALFKDQDYYESIYGFDRSEMQIENGGFVKLRELSLSYRLTERLARKLNLQNASVYVTGRNLRGWWASPSGDPEQDLSQGTNAGQQYFRQFSAPQTRSFLFGLRSIF